MINVKYCSHMPIPRVHRKISIAKKNLSFVQLSLILIHETLKISFRGFNIKN